jgi:hypothetical protein
MTGRFSRSVAWAQVRHQRARSAATAGAVAVAVAAFVLLGSVAQGARLDAVATVRGAYRPQYDILVRPAGADGLGGLTETTETTGTTGTAVDQWSDWAGGISPAQWQKVSATPGVAVAAPVAVGGYVLEDSPVVVGADGKPRLVLDLPMPVLVAGVDPAQEDALDGLGAATVSGRPLAAADSSGTWMFSRDGGRHQVTAMPVVVASRPQVGGELRASVSAVPAGPAVAVAAATDTGAATAGLRPGGAIGPGPVTVGADQVYGALVQDLAAPPDPVAGRRA